MADSHLAILGLDDNTVSTRINYLKNRANRHRNVAKEVDPGDGWKRAALFGAAGFCTVQAASLTILSERENTAESLLQSGAQDYLAANLPYGLVIQCLHASEPETNEMLFHSPTKAWLQEIDRASRDQSGESRSWKELPPNLSTLNQQAYLCMALLSTRQVTNEHQQPLGRLMHRLKDHSNVPHGPQSQPLSVLLDILEAIFHANLDSTRVDAFRAMQAIRRLALHYGESIGSARHNDYLWTNFWSPVDYLDLEIVFVARCLARALEGFELTSIVQQDTFASIPISIAAKLQGRPRPMRA